MEATFVRDRSEDFTGTAHLYKLSEPVEYHEWTDDGEEVFETEYVIVSATIAYMSGAETFIFPADEGGSVLNWGELPGSFKGAMDIEKALQGMCCDIAQ